MSLVNSIVLIGIFAVFGVLVVLSILFSLMENIMNIKIEKKPKTTHAKESNPSEEEITAVITAVHLFLNSSDKEDAILTIERKDKVYSPWSSKIYSVYSNVFYRN